jgi:hypothetical protein
MLEDLAHSAGQGQRVSTLVLGHGRKLLLQGGQVPAQPQAELWRMRYHGAEWAEAWDKVGAVVVGCRDPWQP